MSDTAMKTAAQERALVAIAQQQQILRNERKRVLQKCLCN